MRPNTGTDVKGLPAAGPQRVKKPITDMCEEGVDRDCRWVVVDPARFAADE